MPKDVEQQDLDENSASTKRGGVLLRSAGSQGRGSKAARVAALLGTAGGMDLLCSSPCYAGCLCDAVALYVASTGQLIGLSFLIGAVTILFMKKWAISAKLAATGAIAIVLGSWVRDA